MGGPGQGGMVVGGAQQQPGGMGQQTATMGGQQTGGMGVQQAGMVGQQQGVGGGMMGGARGGPQQREKQMIWKGKIKKKKKRSFHIIISSF